MLSRSIHISILFFISCASPNSGNNNSENDFTDFTIPEISFNDSTLSWSDELFINVNDSSGEVLEYSFWMKYVDNDVERRKFILSGKMRDSLQVKWIIPQIITDSSWIQASFGLNEKYLFKNIPITIELPDSETPDNETLVNLVSDFTEPVHLGKMSEINYATLDRSIEADIKLFNSDTTIAIEDIHYFGAHGIDWAEQQKDKYIEYATEYLIPFEFCIEGCGLEFSFFLGNSSVYDTLFNLNVHRPTEEELQIARSYYPYQAGDILYYYQLQIDTNHHPDSSFRYDTSFVSVNISETDQSDGLLFKTNERLFSALIIEGSTILWDDVSATAYLAGPIISALGDYYPVYDYGNPGVYFPFTLKDDEQFKLINQDFYSTVDVSFENITFLNKEYNAMSFRISDGAYAVDYTFVPNVGIQKMISLWGYPNNKYFELHSAIIDGKVIGDTTGVYEALKDSGNN